MAKFKLWEKLVRLSQGSTSRSDYSLLSDEIIPEGGSSMIATSSSISSANISSPVENSSSSSSQLLNILMGDFACVCCFQILKSPVTLECGHSFCELCLAKWYLTGSSNTCPTCRYEWKTLPRINRNLKSCIEKLVKFEQSRSPNSLDQHYTKVKSADSIEINRTLAQFKAKCAENRISSLEMASSVNTGRPNQNQNTRPNANFVFRPAPVNFDANVLNFNNFLGTFIANIVRLMIVSFVQVFVRGLMFLVFAFIVGAFVGSLIGLAGLIWSSAQKTTVVDMSSNIDQLRVKYQKRVEDWTPGETQEWFFQLGPWATNIAIVSQSKHLSKKLLFIYID
jgi:hypothetical protein